MSASLALVALMGGALALTAWMWVPPRRSSGFAPVVSRDDTPEATPIRSGEMQRPPTFADLVTIGSPEYRPSMPRLPRRMRAALTLGAKPGELVQTGQMRRSVVVEVTAEQKRAIVLAAALDVADDTDPGDDDPTPEQEPDEDEEDDDSADDMPPVVRASERRAADFRAARYGLVRLDGGVRWVGVETERIDTLPPAAVEDDAA